MSVLVMQSNDLELTVPKMVVVRIGNSDNLLTLSLNTAKMSGNLKNMFEDIGEENLKEAVPLSGENVDVFSFKKFIEYYEHYSDGKFVEYKDNTTMITGWDKEFVSSLSKDELFTVMKAANFLDACNLKILCCKKSAEDISKMDTPEIREYFDIENDLTAEEEEEIRKENAWCDQTSS